MRQLIVLDVIFIYYDN